MKKNSQAYQSRKLVKKIVQQFHLIMWKNRKQPRKIGRLEKVVDLFVPTEKIKAYSQEHGVF